MNLIYGIFRGIHMTMKLEIFSTVNDEEDSDESLEGISVTANLRS